MESQKRWDAKSWLVEGSEGVEDQNGGHLNGVGAREG